MTLAHARALLPSIDPRVEAHAPTRDLAALQALAQWMIRFVPIVAVDASDGLLLDITGCARLYKSERRLINRIADAVLRLGFGVRVASAPTFACARAVARAGRRQRSLVPPDRVREALAPLPVRALGIDEEIEESLREIAIDRIGHLFDLPRNSLPARFGNELLFRLDQALGQAIETIEPVRPVPPPEVEQLFAGPVKQLQAIEMAICKLLKGLARELLHRESGVRDLLLTLDRSDLDPLHISIALSHPSRSVKHLWSLLSPHVECAHMGFGVERVVLLAQRIERLPHEQGEIGKRDKETKRPRDKVRGELFDMLINRLGRENVCRHLPVESHIPECAFREMGVMEEKAQRGRATKRRSDKATKESSIVNPRLRGDPSFISITPHGRPTILFDHPDPIKVLAVTPESPPSWLTWRAHPYEVLFGCGPERIGEVWWDEERHGGTKARRHEERDEKTERQRDEAKQRTTNHEPIVNRQSSIINQSMPLILLQRSYYRVLLQDGRFLWVFRHLLSGRWFVHGEWA